MYGDKYKYRQRYSYVCRWGKEIAKMQMPEYVWKNLEFFIDHEHERPEYSEKILEISIRYGI